MSEPPGLPCHEPEKEADWFGASAIGPSTIPACSSRTVTFERFAFPVFVTVPVKEIGWPGAGASWQALVTSIPGAHVTPQAEEAAPTEERVKGMPSGYEELTVAAIKEQSAGWNRPMLEAALEYEQAHGKRKGAIAALESALADKEQS